MHREKEQIFIGHDNRIDLILMADDVVVDLSSFDRMTLSNGGVILVDSDNATDDHPITWLKAGYQIGEVRFKLGAEGVPPGVYNITNPLYLVLYSSQFPNGVVWPPIPCVVTAEVASEV